MMRSGRSFSGQERKCVYLNTVGSPQAGGRFACVSAASGLDYPDDGRAVALVDWDEDGDVDLWVTNRTSPQVRFFRNNSNNGDHHLALRLQGNGTTCNRDGIGARVEVIMAGRPSATAGGRLIQTLHAGEGYLAQSSKWLHFGLGDGGLVDKVVVRWPGGAAEEFAGLAAGQRAVLVQGSGRAHVAPPSRRQLALSPAEQKTPETPGQGKVRFVTPVVVPRLPIATFDGRTQPLPLQKGRFTLINLWASWCQPCMVELREFARREKDLQATGIDVLALSVDGLQGADTGAAEAEAVARRLALPFTTARATPVLLNDLYGLRNVMMVMRRKPQIPSSFLLDRQNRLLVMYTGPVSIDEVIKDATSSGGDLPRRFQWASPMPGRIVNDKAILTAMTDAEALVHYLGALQFAGFSASQPFDQAIEEYEEALKLKPSLVQLHLEVATILLRRGRFAEAKAHCREAIRIRPESIDGYVILGNIASRENNLPEADEYYKQALRINPKYSTAYHNLGKIAESRNDLVAAEAYYQQASVADPLDVAAHVSLSALYFRLRRGLEAQKQCELALALDPDHAEAHSNLGAILFHRGQLDEALKHYERAAKLAPNNAEAQFNLGVTFERKNDLTRSIVHYKKALALAKGYGLKQLVNRCEVKLAKLSAPPSTNAQPAP